MPKSRKKSLSQLILKTAKKYKINLGKRASPSRVRSSSRLFDQPRVMGVQVASPRARPCGSADIKSKDRYLKEELVALAKASGIDHKQNMDQLCDALGIKPHVNEVFLPKKPCNSKARGSERYTKEEVVELARSRGLDVRGKNMDALCSALGIEQTFPYLAPPRMFDEYI